MCDGASGEAKSPEKDEEKVIKERKRRLIYEPPEVPLEDKVPYKQGWCSLVPNAGGVYLIGDLRGPLYVGRGNLRSRFDKHHEESHNGVLRMALRNPVGEISFSWLTVDMPEQGELEKRLIRELQPICNEIMYSNGN